MRTISDLPFPVYAQRFDPYKNFKSQVKWDGKHIYGISKFSMLKRKTEVVVHREGGDPSLDRRSPGITSYEPIRPRARPRAGHCI